MTGAQLDRRRHAYRDDLAAETLRGIVSAPRYVPGRLIRVVAHAAPMLPRPQLEASLDNEALFGELITVFDEADGFAWGQLARDGYVGYLPSSLLAEPLGAITHRVTALSSPVFPRADIKSRPVTMVPLNANLVVTGEDDRFLHLADGTFVVRVHAAPIETAADGDLVAIAERFLGTPYLWGGRTHRGIDCSGLVQICGEAMGISLPRDSDMQRQEAGVTIDWNGETEALERGDIICWQGHVGLYAGEGKLLHANAFHMGVVMEPLDEAIARIGAAGHQVLAVKRLLPRPLT